MLLFFFLIFTPHTGASVRLHQIFRWRVGLALISSIFDGVKERRSTSLHLLIDLESSLLQILDELLFEKLMLGLVLISGQWTKLGLQCLVKKSIYDILRSECERAKSAGSVYRLWLYLLFSISPVFAEFRKFFTTLVWRSIRAFHRSDLILYMMTLSK